jgi:hypothetical protein
MNSHFRKGSGSYTCEECGKRTRDTGAGEASCNLCRFCYEVNEWVNSVNDGDHELSDVPAKYRDAVEERL